MVTHKTRTEKKVYLFTRPDVSYYHSGWGRRVQERGRGRGEAESRIKRRVNKQVTLRCPLTQVFPPLGVDDLTTLTRLPSSHHYPSSLYSPLLFPLCTNTFLFFALSLSFSLSFSLSLTCFLSLFLPACPPRLPPLASLKPGAVMGPLQPCLIITVLVNHGHHSPWPGLWGQMQHIIKRVN